MKAFYNSFSYKFKENPIVSSPVISCWRIERLENRSTRTKSYLKLSFLKVLNFNCLKIRKTLQPLHHFTEILTVKIVMSFTVAVFCC